MTYRQGLDDTSQPQPPPDCEQLTCRLTDRPQWAQALPYSKSVKFDHEAMALASAALRLDRPLLDP